MTNYRRNRVPGGTYFFTVNLLDRRSDLLVQHIQHLRTAVRHARAQAPFHIDAWVVLPEHMHCVWTLPEGDTDVSSRWLTRRSTVMSRSALIRLRGREELRTLRRRVNGREVGDVMGFTHRTVAYAGWQGDRMCRVDQPDGDQPPRSQAAKIDHRCRSIRQSMDSTWLLSSLAVQQQPPQNGPLGHTQSPRPEKTGVNPQDQSHKIR